MFHEPGSRQRYVLDVTCALAAGSDIPIGGVFRGESVEILRVDDEAHVVVRMTDNHLYADREFRVPHECLTESSAPLV